MSDEILRFKPGEVAKLFAAEKKTKSMLLSQQQGSIEQSDSSRITREIVSGIGNPTRDVTDSRERRPETLTELQIMEQRAWQETLGATVEVKPLPGYLTPEIRRNLERLGMELRYIPALELGSKDDIKPETHSTTGAVEAYLKSLEVKYPNWHRYEGMIGADKENHDIPRNLNEWFWEQVEVGDVDFPNLPGQWVAVETMNKARYREKYPSSPLTAKMGLEDRFSVSWDDAKAKIDGIRTDLWRDAGFRPGIPAQVQMLDALSWNLLANREGWGKTDTYEWTNTEYRGGSVSQHTFVGYSGGGGAADADFDISSHQADGIGFRVAIILGS